MYLKHLSTSIFCIVQRVNYNIRVNEMTNTNYLLKT